MKKLSLIALLVISTGLFAQSPFRDGYIVKNDQDTIYGEVEYRTFDKNYRSCIFKSKEGVITEYYPQKDLIGYGFVGGNFFSSEVRDGFFVEALVNGPLSLYKFEERFYLKKDTSIHILESNKEVLDIDGQRRVKEVSNWKGVTAYLISDCLASPSDIKNLKLEEVSLVKLISKYNSCKNHDFIDFKSDRSFTQFRMGLAFGLVRSTIKTSWFPRTQSSSIDYMKDTYHSTDPMIGFTFMLASPRTSENFSFFWELNLIKSKYSELYIKREAQQVEYNESRIHLTTINIPIYLKYSFPKNGTPVFLLTGVSIDSNIKSHTQLSSETVLGNSSVLTNPDMEAFEVKKNQVGWLIGVGSEKKAFGLSLSASLKYTQMSTLSKSPGFNANVSRLSLGLIITQQ